MIAGTTYTADPFGYISEWKLGEFYKKKIPD